VKNALNHLQDGDCSTRLGFVHVRPAVAKGWAGFSTTLHQLVSLSALPGFHSGDLLKLVEHLEIDHTMAGDSAGAQGPLMTLKKEGSEGGGPEDWQEDPDLQYDAFGDAGVAIARQLGINDSTPHLIVNGRVSDRTSPELIHSLSDHYQPVRSPRKTLPLSRHTSTANGSSQSSTCSRQCTTIFPSLTVRHLQIWWRASRRS